MRNSNIYRRKRLQPRGIATLEFAMALPVLLLLMVAITWLGYSVIAQAEVLIQSREKAWQKRFDNPGQKPLVFPIGTGEIKNPLYSTSSDYVTETATKPVNVSPIFKAAPAPKASHTVLAGSWDHRAMDLNSPPNLKLYALAAANAGTGDLQTAIGSLSSLASNLTQLGASALSKGFESLAGVNSSGGEGDSAANTDKQKTNQNKEVDRAALQSQLQQKKTELAQTNQQIDQSNAQSAAQKNTPPPPPTGTAEEQQQAKDQQQAQQKAGDRKLQLLKDQKKRLESEIDNLQEKLDSLD